MTPDEFGMLYDAVKQQHTELIELRKENTDSHRDINDHLTKLNSKVLKHDIAINGENPGDACIKKDIANLKTLKGWILKNAWWLAVLIVLALLGSGGELWQFIEGWVKRGMPG
jgi:hypothetical protein